MNRFEGLNLPDLLGLMHDLSMPAPVSLFPATPGWWILAAWLLAITLIVVLALRNRYRRNQYRRDALAALDAIDKQNELTPAEAAQQVAAILKRTALAAYPRESVATLTGPDWAQFLVQSSNNDRKVAEAAPLLATCAYRPDADGHTLGDPARRWIRLHRA